MIPARGSPVTPTLSNSKHTLLPGPLTGISCLFAELSASTFKRLRLFALDPYDLALAKLECNIQRDRDDVKHLARTIPLDLKVL
jgi:hypothetical protein